MNNIAEVKTEAVAAPEKQADGTVTKKDLRRCAIRWLMGVNTFNYGGQLSASVVFALAPVLRKMYPDDDDYIKSLNNQYKYFNTTPPIAGLLLGAGLAMEDKEGLKALDAVQNLKVGLMGSMAGIGDTLCWILIPTIFGSIAGYMGLQGNPIGAFLLLGIYIALFVWKLFFFEYGYKFGVHVVTQLGQKLNIFTEVASILGLTVVGALIATVITLKTGIAFSFGKISMPLQTGILDKIFPALLPIAATWIVYKLIQKKANMTLIILGIIVVSMIGAATGIFVK
jgi:Phosphotransferase system, mannose/fructose/N-acetylgalactosamine-specific component IID